MCLPSSPLTAVGTFLYPFLTALLLFFSGWAVTSPTLSGPPRLAAIITLLLLGLGLALWIMVWTVRKRTPDDSYSWPMGTRLAVALALLPPFAITSWFAGYAYPHRTAFIALLSITGALYLAVVWWMARVSRWLRNWHEYAEGHAQASMYGPPYSAKPTSFTFW